MINLLRKLFEPKGQAPRHSVPPGERVYAIGDIHGRLDLFERLIEAVERDDAQRPPARTTMILLGDLVDRGPDSAGVLARARAWQQARKVHILAGNHEEMFLDSFENIEILRHFLKHGGRETLLSYRPDEETYNNASLEELQALMHTLVPPEDRRFIEAFEGYCLIGDYLFVHAGIKPEVPLAEQVRRDLLWIRDPFLRYEPEHPYMVIHGHTIYETVDEQNNRIGIDTGAFRSGVLTAIMLEGGERQYIQAVDDDGAISILQGPQAA